MTGRALALLACLWIGVSSTARAQVGEPVDSVVGRLLADSGRLTDYRPEAHLLSAEYEIERGMWTYSVTAWHGRVCAMQATSETVTLLSDAHQVFMRIVGEIMKERGTPTRMSATRAEWGTYVVEEDTVFRGFIAVRDGTVLDCIRQIDNERRQRVSRRPR